VGTEEEMLATLLASREVSEPYHVTTFKCYRARSDGTDKEITVTLLDSGPNQSSTRYRVRADDEDGNHASGNPASTIVDAVANVHWEDLDV
jgi:hypothetical protein